MERRRKLFSSPARRKLFCDEAGACSKKSVICSDCGYKMETTAGTNNLICPKCGGHRFNVVAGRKKLFDDEGDFQKAFSETSDEFELKLKKFSGKVLSEEAIQREFSALGYTAEDLVEKGFAETESGDRYKIREDAFIQSRLFSNLVITITKQFDLDPAVTLCADKGCVIDRLEEEGNLCPKSIVLLKKAHGIPVDGDWLRDSGICSDLKCEFGGHTHEVPEFKKILDDRYPDAPEDIMEVLKDHGVLRFLGDGKVEIVKH